MCPGFFYTKNVNLDGQKMKGSTKKVALNYNIIIHKRYMKKIAPVPWTKAECYLLK